jgi:hypothetical protein
MHSYSYVVALGQGYFISLVYVIAYDRNTKYIYKDGSGFGKCMCYIITCSDVVSNFAGQGTITCNKFLHIIVFL